MAKPSVSLMARIGATLLRCQVAERHIRRCLVYVFPADGDEPVTLDSLSRFETEYAKSTLGKMLARVRQIKPVSPEFDEALGRFLTKRNILAHGLMDMVGPDLHETKQLDDFLSQLHKDAALVGDVFYELVAVWAGTLSTGLAIESTDSMSNPQLAENIDRVVRDESRRPPLARET